MAPKMEFWGRLSCVELINKNRRTLRACKIVARVGKNDDSAVLYAYFVVGFHFAIEDVHHLNVFRSCHQKVVSGWVES